jgi:hypothetical protein
MRRDISLFLKNILLPNNNKTLEEFIIVARDNKNK